MIVSVCLTIIIVLATTVKLSLAVSYLAGPLLIGTLKARL